jgi:uncharacterized protein (TIGR04255 family)
MGKLKHAPVFYVIAQVIHSPVLKLDSIVPDLQERLRKEGFPGYQERKQPSVQIVADLNASGNTKVEHSHITSHIFTSRDQTESFVVHPDNFALQTVEYGTIETFSERFAIGIRAIQDLLAPDSFTRVGLRFLDAIAPPAEVGLATYIRPEFLGLQATLGEDWLLDYGFSETLLVRDDQVTKARMTIRSGSLSFPPDLAPIAPALPARFAGLNGAHALLDTDTTFLARQGTALEFNEGVILDRLKGLKRDVRDSFKAIVTEDAIRAWT